MGSDFFIPSENDIEKPLPPLPETRRRPFHFLDRLTFTWRAGVRVALCVCIFAFCVNLALIVTGIFAYDGYKDRVAFLNRGKSGKIAILSTTYHVLINILSTGLLTASNYCMQLLCAPTRDEIDIAHVRGQWLDIGILSFHNLRYISRKRSLMLLVLAITSVPLHVFYNSAIYGIVTGQNYRIHIVNGSDITALERASSGARLLSNSTWRSLYNTRYVPDSGDLYICADLVSFDISLNYTSTQWGYALPDNNTNSFWRHINSLQLQGDPLDFIIANVTLDKRSGKFIGGQPSKDQRVVLPVADYNNSIMPNFTWPEPKTVYPAYNPSWKDVLRLNNESWMYPPLHLTEAYSQPIENSSSIQIALPYMIIIVVCNALKVIVVCGTLYATSSERLATQGDAIASFLQRPDSTTLGCCLTSSKKFKDASKGRSETRPARWHQERRRFGAYTCGGWKSNSFICFTTLLILIVLIYCIACAKNTDGPGPSWGTASDQQIPFALRSFDTSGVLFNTWLANAPQLILSLSYFALNRLCTSMCFIKEWNEHAITRKGLRVTSPQNQQRPAHFLQLPYRWAIPLVSMSGILHWLLSQSIFLVRIEIRDENGRIVPEESKSTCGYSSLSLLVFAIVFLILLATIFFLLMRAFDVKMPPAEHCSLVISAAFHAPADEVDGGLRAVQWGAVRDGGGGGIGQCSFTSEEFEELVEGASYA